MGTEPAGSYLINFYRAVKIEAGMEELELKRQVIFAPVCPVRDKPDVAHLVISDFQKPLGHFAARILIRFRSKLAGLFNNILQAKHRLWPLLYALLSAQACDG